MDVVTLQAAKADAKRRYVDAKILNRRLLPGISAIPQVSASPPTVAATAVTVGTILSASTITGGAQRILPDYPGAFTIGGTSPSLAAAVGGSLRALQSAPYAVTSPPPWWIEFELDTVNGTIDIITKDNNSGLVALVDGQRVTTGRTFTSPGNTGNPVLNTISGLSAGFHRIRCELEPSSVFVGVNIGKLDAVRATRKPGLRFMVIGDSFAEPTTSDSTSGYARMGFVQWLAYTLGVDAWSAGSGGTGYLKTNGGRTKYRDRMAEFTQYAPDIVLWTGGINDYANFTAAQIGAEALLCFEAMAAALPNCHQFVASPFYPKGHFVYPSTLLAACDAIKASALTAGLPFLDVLTLPVEVVPQPSGAVAANSAIGASTISSSVSFAAGTVVQIGVSPTAEIRTVASVSGVGPFTLTVAEGGQNLANAHTTGETIQQVGPGYLYGSGVQGATTSIGDSNRYTGTDTTHPTQAGHLNLAIVLTRLYDLALTA